MYALPYPCLLDPLKGGPRHVRRLRKEKNVDLHPYISICSGAGGLDIGVDRGSGGTTVPVCYVEREVTAAATLVSNITQGTLADAPIWSDIKTFDFAAWRGQVEGIVGGYPCQPFSAVGPKLGAADPRHLWPYIEEGIETVRPLWCFFENVSGHLSLGFDTVAEGLRRMGYQVAATLVTAEEVGASHQRERLFILGYTTCDRRKEKTVRFSSSSGRSTIQMERTTRYAYGPKNGRWMDVPQGLQPSLAKSEFLRMADGDGRWIDISRQDRIRVIGNGVVPDAAALAWNELWNEVG